MPSPLHSHTSEELARKIDDAVNLLMEHFEAVQILATFPDTDGGTARLFRGRGNWYARMGMAHEFIDMDRAQNRGMEIAKHLPPPSPPDDGEEWKQQD